MKLIPITISDLSYLEGGQFIVRLLSDYASSGLNPATDPDFKALLDDLIRQSPIFNDSLMQIRAKAETGELVRLDDIRDKKLTVLHRGLSIFEHSSDIGEKAAYSLIKIILKMYKGIDALNYEAESLAIDNLVSELRDSGNLEAVQLLGLEIHVNGLEDSNTDFKNKFNARSKETFTQTVYDTKMLRREIFVAYRELAEYVLVMAKRKKTAYYIDTLAVINNGRQYFAGIATRHNNAPKEKAENNTPL